MNKLVFTLSFFLFVLVGYPQNATLRIRIQNIELVQGRLFVSLTNDSLIFAKLNSAKSKYLAIIEVKNSSEEAAFKSLKSGWYAIAVFQDLNGNDSLDIKKFGIPDEPFGFSLNALAKYRPPYFKMARFYVKENEVNQQVINLIYRKPKNGQIKTGK
jgi:uncharacterized protein (DUF2141 family)